MLIVIGLFIMIFGGIGIAGAIFANYVLGRITLIVVRDSGSDVSREIILCTGCMLRIVTNDKKSTNVQHIDSSKMG